MKLDVHHEFGPTIRLHDFDTSELQRLRETLAALADGAHSVVPLHEQPYIEPLEGCRFTLKSGDTDQGIRPEVEPNLFGWLSVPGTWEPYVCVLRPETWARVVAGVELLLHLRFLCGVYVWLHKQWHAPGSIHWLLSTDGEW